MANIIEFVIKLKDQFSGTFKKVQNDFDKTSKKAKKAKKDVSGFGDSIMAIGAMAGVGIIAKQFIELGFGVEQARADFISFTGSAKIANTLIGEMRETAKSTPFAFDDLQKGARTMLSFGIEAAEVNDNLMMFSKITGGNKQRLDSLSLAFSQSSAAGRILGMDLLQMINAGFNPLKQISDDTGISMLDLKKGMENGVISFNFVRQAFERATGAGGMFENRLKELEKTGFGQLSFATGEFSTLMSELAEGFTTSLIPLIKGFRSMVQWMSENRKIIKILLGVFGTLATGLSVLVFWFSVLQPAIIAFNIAITANPIGVIVMAIAALVVGLKIAYDEFAEFRAFFSSMGDVFQNFGKNIMKWVNDPIKQLKSLFHKTLAPFLNAIQLAKEGDWGGAALALGEGLVGVTPIGVLSNTIGEGTGDIYSDALKKERLAEKGDKLKDDQREKQAIDQDLRSELLGRLGDKAGSKKAGSKSGGTHGIGISGKGGNRNITITKLQIADTVIVRTEEDLKMLEKNMMTLLTGALNDANQQA